MLLSTWILWNEYEDYILRTMSGSPELNIIQLRWCWSDFSKLLTTLFFPVDEWISVWFCQNSSKRKVKLPLNKVSKLLRRRTFFIVAQVFSLSKYAKIHGSDDYLLKNKLQQRYSWMTASASIYSLTAVKKAGKFVLKLWMKCKNYYCKMLCDSACRLFEYSTFTWKLWVERSE